MKKFSYYHLGMIGINLLLCILAFQGFFDGKDLLPVLIGGIFILMGSLVLFLRKKDRLNYHIIGLVLVMGSSYAVYHIHFNIYNQQKALASRDNSIEILQGHKAPEVTFAYQYNQSENLDFQAYISKNKYTVLNFWATWCSPCLKEMPILNDFYVQNQSREIGVIGFTDFTREKIKELQKIEKVMNRLQISYPILVDSTLSVRTAYRADILPATVLLDQEGNVVDYQVGIEGAKKIMKYVNDYL